MSQNILLKVSSAEQPWPGKPAAYKFTRENWRDYALRHGGKASTRFADGVIYIAIHGLNADLITPQVNGWRKQINKRKEKTKIEQLNDTRMPPKGEK